MGDLEVPLFPEPPKGWYVSVAFPSFEVIFCVIFLLGHDSSGVEEFESTASRFSVVQRSEVFGLSLKLILQSGKKGSLVLLSLNHVTVNPKCFQVFWLVKLTTSEPSSFAGFHAEIPIVIIVLVAKSPCLPVKPPNLDHSCHFFVANHHVCR